MASPLDVAALMALAQPARIRLWELLDVHGPATAAQLAALTADSPDAVDDHLRELSRHGIIESRALAGPAPDPR